MIEILLITILTLPLFALGFALKVLAPNPGNEFRYYRFPRVFYHHFFGGWLVTVLSIIGYWLWPAEFWIDTGMIGVTVALDDVQQHGVIAGHDWIAAVTMFLPVLFVDHIGIFNTCFMIIYLSANFIYCLHYRASMVHELWWLAQERIKELRRY